MDTAIMDTETQDLEALLEVLKVIYSTLNTTRLFEVVVEKAVELTGADRGGILTRQKDGLFQLEVARAGDGADITDFPYSRTVLEQAAATGKSLFMHDVQDDAGLKGRESIVAMNIRMVFCAPLIDTEGEVIGAIYVDSVDPARQLVPERRLRTLDALAEQAVIALQRAQMFEQVQALYEKTMRLDKAKLDFIQIASHELRTPISIIKGYVDMLASAGTVLTEDAQRVIVDQISGGATRLTTIVNMMLLVAQIDQGGLEIAPALYSTRLLVEQVGQNWQEIIEQQGRDLRLNVVVELEQGESLWPVDQHYMGIALTHLVQNAVKFTPDGGKITLRLTRPGSGLQIEVEDTGIGIENGYREVIFEKFYRAGDVRLHSTGQTKFMGAGPGLGLFLARGIIEAHGGRVWVESGGLGQGSRFIIRLSGS